jgi:hypothetical protein
MLCGIMSPRPAFAWLSEHQIEALGAADRSLATQPALRVWGDALLAHRAARRAHPFVPSVVERATAAFAWPERTSHAERSFAHPRFEVKLTVDASRCAVARFDVIEDFFTPTTWRRVRAALVDRGHDRERLEEELPVVAAPGVPMNPLRADSILPGLDEDLLNDLEALLADQIDRYLDSWHLYEAFKPSPGAWEIVIPVSAITRVERLG